MLRPWLRHVVKVGFGLVQVLLLIRVVVLLFAPSPTDPVINGLLDVTQPFVDPFRDAVRASLEERVSGSILDAHAMAALVGYTAIEIALLVAISWRKPKREPLPPLPAGISSDRSQAPTGLNEHNG